MQFTKHIRYKKRRIQQDYSQKKTFKTLNIGMKIDYQENRKATYGRRSYCSNKKNE